jgi:hypothetical protein
MINDGSKQKEIRGSGGAYNLEANKHTAGSEADRSNRSAIQTGAISQSVVVLMGLSLWDE